MSSVRINVAVTPGVTVENGHAPARPGLCDLADGRDRNMRSPDGAASVAEIGRRIDAGGAAEDVELELRPVAGGDDTDLLAGGDVDGDGKLDLINISSGGNNLGLRPARLITY